MRAGDLTGSAAILHAAMRLAGERGWPAVSVRDIAAAAGVSSSLVVHHYGTKVNLRAAVDRRAVDVFVELVDEMSGARPEDLQGDGEPLTTSLTAAFEARLGADGAVYGYVRRLLVDGGDAAQELFDTVYLAISRMLDELQARGLVVPTDDPATRAAFLLVNDLAVMLLRDQVTHATGVDPLSRSGMQRWGRTLMTVYRDGVFVATDNPGKGDRDESAGDRTGKSDQDLRSAPRSDRRDDRRPSG